jgi:uncharacterized protein (TIGR00251 family)
VTLDEVKRELATRGEVRLKVKVTPKSGRSEIAGFLADGTLKVKLLAAPERGKANQELCALLAKHLGVRPRQVEILTGETSPLKHVRVSSA